VMIGVYTAAYAVNWSRSSAYDHILNEEVRSISCDWIQCQPGTTLSNDITSTQTVITVGDTTYFDAGELVVIGGTLADPFTDDTPTNRTCELAVVNTVDSSTQLTLYPRSPTLQTLGYFYPSKAHVAGIRIAPSYITWPGCVACDMTAGCPSLTVDESVGPETFNEWNVRRVVTEIEDCGFEGAGVDVWDDGHLWYLTYSTNDGVIDLNRNNSPDTAGEQDAFIDAWRLGLEDYMEKLRAALGETAPITSNGRYMHSDTGGRLYEAWPDASTSYSTWYTLIFGPWTPNDMTYWDYMDWSTSAHEPHVTTFMVSTGDTDYKLMRYGLCTTLLGDGFFSSNNHEYPWFDEYSVSSGVATGDGTATGWLGQPTAAATSIGTNCFIRRFDHGCAIINPDLTTARTIPYSSLGSGYSRIDGTQAASINNGDPVTGDFSLPAHDGIILWK